MDASFVRVPAQDCGAVLDDASAARSAIDRSATEPSRRLDIDESWAALHFLLSGELPIPKHEALERGASWDGDSLENVIMGGEPTPFGASFGPARLLNPSAVAELADQLAQLDQHAVMELYNADQLIDSEIPPDGWDVDPHRKEWLRDALARLVSFFREAATAGDGLIVYMI